MDEEVESGAGETKSSTDSRIPEPLGLSTYIQVLGEWAKGMVSEPYLLGLIRSAGFGEAERAEFLAGADQLWGLVPPIDAPDVAEAELEPEAARALGLALALQGEHALHHHLPSDGAKPRVLTDIAELVTVIHLILEGHQQTGSAAEKRLKSLQKRLAARSVNTTRLAGRKEDVREAVLARRRIEDQERRDEEAQEKKEAASREKKRRRAPTEIPMKGLLFTIASLFVALTLFNTLTPKPSGGLPSAAEYKEVPVIGIIRHPDIVYVRVEGEWLLESESARKLGARRLWDRLSQESGGNVARVVLQTRTGTDLAFVTATGVRWQGPVLTRRAPPPVREGTDRSPASGEP